MSIYPAYIPSTERSKERRAELLVYDLLSKLSERWTILYNKSIKLEHAYGISDREADFIIAHPDLGVLVLEVKGGSISCEAGVWYTAPLQELHKPPEQRRRERLKRSPYAQATDTAKKFERKLDRILEDRRMASRPFDICTAVCFPDIEIPEDLFLGADAPRALAIDKNDLDNLQQRLFEIFQVHQKSGIRKPREYGIKILIDFLAPSWEINTSFAYQFEQIETQQKELTDEQFTTLYYFFEDNPRSLVSGCAGSGKTVLATEAALKFANEGKLVLLVCYNHNLAEILKTHGGRHSKIVSGDFHEICFSLAEDVPGVDLPRWSEKLGIDKEQYFGEQMPNALLLAVAEKNLLFDAIIVDEGQDFHPNWLKTLEQLLHDPNESHFHIFFDDNQRIYDRKRIPFTWPCSPLTKNLRNTDPIHKQVLAYYHDPSRNRPSGIKGPEPLFVDPQAHGGEIETVRYALERLEAEGIPPEWIVILTPRAEENSVWQPKNKVRWGKFSPVWRLQTIGKQVSCCSVLSFKGLEKPVVILTELSYLPQEPQQRDQLLYVAMSRAKTHLIVIGNKIKLR